MANEAYRAVFLRIHPTGKMVLSLTTEADGHEVRLRPAASRDELGVPSLDVKVVPGRHRPVRRVGHGYNTSPSPGTAAAIDERHRQDPGAKAHLLAGAALDTVTRRP